MPADRGDGDLRCRFIEGKDLAACAAVATANLNRTTRSPPVPSGAALLHFYNGANGCGATVPGTFHRPTGHPVGSTRCTSLAGSNAGQQLAQAVLTTAIAPHDPNQLHKTSAESLGYRLGGARETARDALRNAEVPASRCLVVFTTKAVCYFKPSFASIASSLRSSTLTLEAFASRRAILRSFSFNN